MDEATEKLSRKLELDTADFKTGLQAVNRLFRAIGITEEEAAVMSVEVMKLAVDMASFNKFNTEDVLCKVRAG